MKEIFIIIIIILGKLNISIPNDMRMLWNGTIVILRIINFILHNVQMPSVRPRFGQIEIKFSWVRHHVVCSHRCLDWQFESVGPSLLSPHKIMVDKHHSAPGLWRIENYPVIWTEMLSWLVMNVWEGKEGSGWWWWWGLIKTREIFIRISWWWGGWELLLLHPCSLDIYCHWIRRGGLSAEIKIYHRTCYF